MRKSNFIISLSILGVMCIGGIMAYFSSTDAVTNRMQARDLHIQLSEPSWVEYPEYIVPNQKILKDPMVKNVSETEAYIFLELIVPYADDLILEGNGTDEYQNILISDDGTQTITKTSSGEEMTIKDEATGEITKYWSGVELFRFYQKDGTQGFCSDWVAVGTPSKNTSDKTITYIFVYEKGEGNPKPVLQGEETSTLFDYVKFVNAQEKSGLEPITNKSVKDYHILVNAYAIQTDYLGISEEEKENPVYLWEAYCNASGKA